MRKIGYVYKYNPSEEMGILVYGIWKERRSWGPPIIKNTPILFSASDLLTKVGTGQLVYFDFDGKSASNIERASLANFKLEYIKSLIRCNENEMESSFYENNTCILFERLDNILFPNEEEQKANDFTFDDDYFDNPDFTFPDIYNDVDDLVCSSSITKNNPSVNNEVNNYSNDSIIGLFNCFGKYNHQNGEESFLLNVLDLSLWVDSEILDTEYYGKKVNEISFLYDLFVLRKRYNKQGDEIEIVISDDCISPMWSLLLSKFKEIELKEILFFAPKLQPALPIDFCKKNVGILSIHYGMPNVEICKFYCLRKILDANTISDYKDIKHKLSVFYYCTTNHLEEEGTPMCKMGKRRIKNLVKRLEEQYENVIKPNVIEQLSRLSNDDNVLNEFKTATSDEFNNVGMFIESYNKLKNDFLDYDISKRVLDSYEKLSQIYKDALKDALLCCANESAIFAVQSNKLTPYWLNYNIECFGNWIYESTKLQIKKLVNDRFSKLKDLDDLRNAYEAEYITMKQYYYQYKQLTSNFTTYQFLKELADFKIVYAPMHIQWYVVSCIIKQLGYKSLGSCNFVDVEFYGSVYDVRSLLKWLMNYGHLKNIVLKKAVDKICSVLSDNEKWALFEEKIVQSPGMVNIRKRLNDIYKSKSVNKELFKHACFQDVMLSDVDSIKDQETKLFIVDNLDSEHQYLMQQKAKGFLKLYLWQKEISNDYDWNLIKLHYHELSAKNQIKILRFIFGRMALGELSFSINELYSAFVDTATPACPAICAILFILKEKMKDMNVSVSWPMIESVIGKEFIQRWNFLDNSKEFFYSCYGYMALSTNKFDVRFQSFNGALTKEIKNDELYYVVQFYNSPIDLFGRTIEWLDCENVEIAKQILLKNSYIDVVDGKYYIHESHEFFVKQFVIAYYIEDNCGLMSDKKRMIELGYLPPNNAYQPLYTNQIRKYEKSDNYICRGGCYGDSDSNNNIPFFWCKKKMCVRRAHFLLPPSKWEEYRFVDLLFIALGQSADIREPVWRVNSEISQFICDCIHAFKSNDRNVCSKPLNEFEEIGVWDETSSVCRDIYDDDNYDEEIFEDYLFDY